jgi:putative membrane protein
MKIVLNTQELTSLIALMGVLSIGGLAAAARASDSIMPKEAKTLSHGDKGFIMMAARASTNEVALSQLADSRGASPEVKSFAQMMITDHGQANSDLQALAMSKGIDITKPVDKGKMDDVSSLSSKSGTDFDKAYAGKMVSVHDGAVELFKKEASEGKDPDVVAFVKRYVDTLSMHLEHAKARRKTVDQ